MNTREKSTIPSGWQEVKLGELCDVLPKKEGLKRKDYLENGKYPIFDQGQEYVSAYSNNDKILQTDFPVVLFGDHSCTVKKIDQDYILGNDGIKIMKSKESVDDDFLYYVILNAKIPQTGYNRHFKYLKEQAYLLPPFPQQQKIASILMAVDEQIEKTDQIIEKTEELKKGLMQELFSKGIGHTRFKKTEIGEVPEEWEVVKLEDVVNKFIGGGTPSRSNGSYWGGNIPWLSVKDFHQGLYILGSSENITKEGLSNSSSKIVPRGEIIIATRVGLGNAFITQLDIAINQDLRGLVVDQNQMDTLYLLWFLKNISDKIIQDGSGTTVKGVNINTVRNYLIPKPNIKEQKQIASILSSVDEKIEVNKKIKTQLAQLKKGLMADLLSGKTLV